MSNLNPDQFHTRIVDVKSGDRYYGEHPAMEVHHFEGPQDIAARGAAVAISPPHNQYLYNRDLIDDRHPDRADIVTYHPHNEPGPQTAMFGVLHEPPKVDLLMSSFDRPKGSVSRVLGVGALESHARWGEYPVPSGDLSKHSAPMVQRLVDKGVVEKPEQDYREDFDWDDDGNPVEQFHDPSAVKVTNSVDHGNAQFMIGLAHRTGSLNNRLPTSTRDVSPAVSNLGMQFFKKITGQTS